MFLIPNNKQIYKLKTITMNTKYYDLINQTFYFPQEEFTLNKDALQFHGIDLMKLVEEYGTPLKFTYLPKISQNINKAKMWFRNSMEKHGYEAKYFYCYCTKSSHFEFVLNEALKIIFILKLLQLLTLILLKN